MNTWHRHGLRENLDDPFQFRYAKMKVGLPTFMLTADELTTVQPYGHENGKAVFL